MGLENRIPLRDGLVVNQDQILNLHIQAQQLAQDLPLIHDAHWQLALNLDGSEPQFFLQGLLINILDQARPAQFSMHLKGGIHDDLANLVFGHKNTFNAKTQRRRDAKSPLQHRGPPRHLGRR